MGIFDFFRSLKGSNVNETQKQKEENRQFVSVELASQKSFEGISCLESNAYVRVDDRGNRYELIASENIVNDEGEAEAYENGLLNRFGYYENMICPNCDMQLEKVPKQRGKCPYCKEPVYVVKSYIEVDRLMLLTHHEKESLKKYREAFFNFKRLSINLHRLGITKNDYEKVKETLGSKFSYRDVVWNLMNTKSLEEFHNKKLGLHRNVHQQMGQFLEDENNYKAALQQYLYITYLDVNGCSNRDKIYPLSRCFEISTGLVAPGILKAIVKCMEKCDMNIDNLREEFMELEKRNLPTPITVGQSWNRFQREYNKLYCEK